MVFKATIVYMDTSKPSPRYFLIALILVLVFSTFAWKIYSSPKENSSDTDPILSVPVKDTHPYATSSIAIAGTTVTVDLAITPEQHTLGLSGRKSLQKHEGMLFVFDIPADYGFWMKDMLFPIDIIWISQEKKVIYIEKNVSPNTYPKSFSPGSLAKYVFEVQAGFSDAYALKVGDIVNF